MTYHKLLAAALLAAAPITLIHAATPAFITAAVADKSRPPEDVALDAERKPAESLEFAGVKPGQTVVDLIPGGGYFTKLFADAVGPTGKVVPYVPNENITGAKDPQKAADKLTAAGAGHANVEAAHPPLGTPPTPGTADIVWTSQNYHDLHNVPNLDLTAFNKTIFAALKPGGVFIVLDHAAAAGSGVSTTNTLHRIDPAVVKQEVTAAGFVFVGESKVLANPADDHTLAVFDKTIRHHTDQFIYKFRKPKK